MSFSHHDRRPDPRPSLRSLEVFVAAAEHGNFTAAGRALGITQSAVSRQVADLESMIGVVLFLRRGARLSLTPTGGRLVAGLSPALADARRAVAEVASAQAVVTLSMLPSVAAKWLAPRLGGFVSAHPYIDLRVSASRHLVDFAAEGIDAAIRYGPKPAPGLVAHPLAEETVTPVAAPGYVRDHALHAPADLARATLLHGDIPEDWPEWCAAASVPMPPPEGPRLGDDTTILQAAIEGNGVALGRSHLISEDIAAGRLVAPFPTHLKARYAYWFVYPEGLEPTAALIAVRDWTIAAFAAT
ncbi:LysR substrate-binding domain-containing protein [Dinoroseobacter sp. S375]|uniref:LysR substrate-binding domain-containing protein n=1 Tax=Dinoroseobacter sp. S375 TaxID=3415136 RepID=UPI003C7A8A8E